MNRRYPQDRRPEVGGFAAVELTVALAVTTLMLALVASAVRTYIVRAQIAESVTRLRPLQHQIVHMFRESGVPPADHHWPGQASSALAESAYVDLINVVDGRIDLRFGRAADTAIAGRVLSLTPFETAALEIIWICGNDIPHISLRPLGFSGGSRQAIQVSSKIDARFLPEMCR